MDSKNKIDVDVINLFNKSDVNARKEMCLKMIDTFEEQDKMLLLEEIDKRNIALKVKKVGGNLTLTQQLLIRNNYAGKYIKSKITKELYQNAKLLDDLLAVCKWWCVYRCTHPFYSNYRIVFLLNKDCYYCEDGYRVAQKYEITDIVTLMEQFRQENIIFGRNDNYFIEEKKQHRLEGYEAVSLISKLAKEKRSTLVL